MKPNHFARLAAFTALALGMSGCLYEFGDAGWGDDDSTYYGDSTSRLNAYDGQLHGGMGDVQVDGDARVYEAVDWGYGASIELRANGVGGVGMNRLDIDGVDISELEPGVYESTGYYASSAGDPNFSVVGCSGPRDDSWEYDVTAEQVTVVVTELGPGELQLDWTADFGPSYDYETGSDGPSHQTTGTVVIVR